MVAFLKTDIWRSSKLQAKLKQVHSPDVWDLQKYQPEVADNFSFLLELSVSTTESEAADNFDIFVCTPEWLKQHHKTDDIVVGRNRLIIFEYNYDRLINFLTKYCSKCSGDTWEEIAEQMSRLAKWEFEDFHRAEGGANGAQR